MKELRDYSHAELIGEIQTRLVSGPAPEPSTPAAEKKQWPAVCAECGAATTVPFKPLNDYPIYCRDCYLKRKK